MMKETSGSQAVLIKVRCCHELVMCIAGDQTFGNRWNGQGQLTSGSMATLTYAAGYWSRFGRLHLWNLGGTQSAWLGIL